MAGISATFEKVHEPLFRPIDFVVEVDARKARIAEIGRGWSKTSGPIKLDLADSYGQFANLHLSQSGIVR